MHADIAEGLVFHYMEQTGTISMWSNGLRVARCKGLAGGSRQFFKLGAYFIKAEYLHLGYVGQCKDEVFVHGMLDNCDKQYFTRLLACSEMTDEGIQWTMFPWYKLSPCITNTHLYASCHDKVARLCDKYSIHDVLPYVNINWFIHKGKPLIVDCGITGDC